jgi:hypothetical protein
MPTPSCFPGWFYLPTPRRFGRVRCSSDWGSKATVCIAFLLLVSPAAGGERSRDRHIIFKPGQETAYAKGRFTKGVAEIYYSFHAHAGQHLRVKIVPLDPELITAGVVIFPSGKQDGGPGGVVFDSDLTETGRYRIRATQRQGEMRGRFRVEVRLRSAPAS